MSDVFSFDTCTSLQYAVVNIPAKFVKWCVVFDDVEKLTTNLPEAETGKSEQKDVKEEEEEYEPLTSAGVNVSTNAKQLNSVASRYRDVNTSNRHYSDGPHDWQRGEYENWWLNKERENERDAARRRDSRRRPTRRHLSSDEDRR